MNARILIPLALAFLLLWPAGCYVPLKESVVSQREIGVRLAGTAGEKAAIVHRVVKQNVLSPMTEEGYGKDYILWNQYYLTRGSGETRLHFLEISMARAIKHAAQKTGVSLREIEPEVRAVDGTTNWIAVRFLRVARETLDMEVIVFDEARQSRVLCIEGIERLSRSTRNLLRNLDFRMGNRQIVFRKEEEMCALDPLTLTITKL